MHLVLVCNTRFVLLWANVTLVDVLACSRHELYNIRAGIIYDITGVWLHMGSRLVDSPVQHNYTRMHVCVYEYVKSVFFFRFIITAYYMFINLVRHIKYILHMNCLLYHESASFSIKTEIKFWVTKPHAWDQSDNCCQISDPSLSKWYDWPLQASHLVGNRLISVIPFIQEW